MEATDRDELQRQMIALRDGDREALGAVYGQVWPALQRFSWRLLGDAADADDAAQQALLKVFSRIMEFDPDREALPWLMGIAYNECRTIRQRRRRAASRQAALTPEVLVAPDDPEQAHMSAELQAALREVMGSGSLGPRDVETLWAAVGRDPRPDIPAATFRKRFQRALSRLRTAWERRHEHL